MSSACCLGVSRQSLELQGGLDQDEALPRQHPALNPQHPRPSNCVHSGLKHIKHVKLWARARYN